MNSGGKSFSTEEIKELQTINILVLDDDKSTSRIIESILTSSDKECSIHTAGHGSAALSLIKSNQFDIVFIDIWLPDMNGLEIIATVKETNPDTICHVISSQSDRSYIDKAMLLGAEQYILKPVKVDQILNIINGFNGDSLSETT